MSNRLTQLAALAQVAQAAYANFPNWPNARQALVEAGFGDFASSEAVRVLGEPEGASGTSMQGFVVQHHQPDDQSGFSATVFVDRSANRYVLAIRGTQGAVDILEDVNRIGVRGYASDQAVSLYRYFKKAITPA